MHRVLGPHQNLRAAQGDTEALESSSLPHTTYPAKFEDLTTTPRVISLTIKQHSKDIEK